MNFKFPALATVLLLTTSFALAEPDQAPTGKNDKEAVTCADASGNPVGQPNQSPQARTREEVHAEAVQAAKEHRSTFSQDLDFLKN